ncbi:ATP-binding cassette domain-containing protein [Bacteroidota bacterium]
MIIRAENLIPLPMTELDTSGSAIWEADSFTFEKETKYLVEAASGKGKTSLLSIFFGLRKDYNGQFHVDGQEGRLFSSRDWSQLRKKKISYIFQGLELFSDLTALENIQLKNEITDHKTISEIISMAERLDIAPFLGKKCGILSFGQQQRVAIVRALCQPFEYLFADECFSHMDRANSEIAFALIHEECVNNGAGLILTSLNDARIDGIDFHFKL